MPRKTSPRRSRANGCSAGTRRCFRQGAAASGGLPSARGANDTSGPMQVVSGPFGPRARPLSKRRPPRSVPREMSEFLDWFNAAQDIDPVLKAGARPFVVRHDPSVRGRQWSDRARHRRHGAWPARKAARSASTACRRRSGGSGMPTTTSSKRRRRVDLDITPWMEWFLGCLNRAFDGAEVVLASVLDKSPLLGEAFRRRLQRSTTRHAEPAARPVWREAHFVEMGEARRNARRTPHSAISMTCLSARFSQGATSGRPQHELFAD